MLHVQYGTVGQSGSIHRAPLSVWLWELQPITAKRCKAPQVINQRHCPPPAPQSSMFSVDAALEMLEKQRTQAWQHAGSSRVGHQKPHQRRTRSSTHTKPDTHRLWCEDTEAEPVTFTVPVCLSCTHPVHSRCCLLKRRKKKDNIKK